MTYKFLIPLLLSGVFAACIKDETPMPNYRQELADISTNALGVATTLTPSDAVPCTILNRVADLRPDTTYRALTLFTRAEQIHRTKRTLRCTQRGGSMGRTELRKPAPEHQRHSARPALLRNENCRNNHSR